MSLFVGNLSNKVSYGQLSREFESKGPCKVQMKVRPALCHYSITPSVSPLISSSDLSPWSVYTTRAIWSNFYTKCFEWASNLSLSSKSKVHSKGTPFSISPLNFYNLPFWPAASIHLNHPNISIFDFRENMHSSSTKTTQMQSKQWKIFSTRTWKASVSISVSPAQNYNSF